MHSVDSFLGREPEVDCFAHGLHREQERKLRVIDECLLRGGHEIGNPEQVVHVVLGSGR